MRWRPGEALVESRPQACAPAVHATNLFLVGGRLVADGLPNAFRHLHAYPVHFGEALSIGGHDRGNAPERVEERRGPRWTNAGQALEDEERTPSPAFGSVARTDASHARRACHLPRGDHHDLGALLWTVRREDRHPKHDGNADECTADGVPWHAGWRTLAAEVPR
jgi:hypothetical protein